MAPISIFPQQLRPKTTHLHKTRHRFIRTPNLQLIIPRLVAIALLVRALHLCLATVLKLVAGAEDVADFLAHERLPVEVALCDLVLVGAGAAGEAVCGRGVAGGRGGGGGGDGEDVGAGGAVEEHCRCGGGRWGNLWEVEMLKMQVVSEKVEETKGRMWGCLVVGLLSPSSMLASSPTSQSTRQQFSALTLGRPKLRSLALHVLRVTYCRNPSPTEQDVIT